MILPNRIGWLCVVGDLHPDLDLLSKWRGSCMGDYHSRLDFSVALLYRVLRGRGSNRVDGTKVI